MNVGLFIILNKMVVYSYGIAHDAM